MLKSCFNRGDSKANDDMEVDDNDYNESWEDAENCVESRQTKTLSNLFHGDEGFYQSDSNEEFNLVGWLNTMSLYDITGAVEQ